MSKRRCSQAWIYSWAGDVCVLIPLGSRGRCPSRMKTLRTHPVTYAILNGVSLFILFFLKIQC